MTFQHFQHRSGLAEAAVPLSESIQICFPVSVGTPTEPGSYVETAY